MTRVWTAEHETIARLVSQRTGLSVGTLRRDSDAAAISRGLRAAGKRNLEQYHQLLVHDHVAMEALAAELTIGETYFFRDDGQFQLVRNRILPEIAASKPDTIRIWSAGCASGEEAYSLALVAHELGLGTRAHVIGTDIARQRLERARAGRYGDWSFRGVPDHVVRTYFQAHGRQLQLAAEIRQRVDFQYLNLSEDTYPSLSTGIWGFDLVLCRNVLIYFEPPAVRRVIRALVDSLADGGWLLLGASDPGIDGLADCDIVSTSAGLAYRKRRAGEAEEIPVEIAVPPVAKPFTAPAVARTPAAAYSPTHAEAAVSVDKGSELLARYAAHDYAGAVAIARALLARRDEATTWITLIRALANQGDLTEAERSCAAALQRHRETAELWYLQSVLLTEQSQFATAVRAARQALYLEPELAVGHLALGAALARALDGPAARRAFGNAERLLAAMPETQQVTASDGEPAGRLLEMARAQLRLALHVSAA